MANVPEWEFAVEFVLDGIIGAPRQGGGTVPLGALFKSRASWTGSKNFPLGSLAFLIAVMPTGKRC